MSDEPASSTGWPLSAAATMTLRLPSTTPGEVLRLALKELVLRGAWRVERSTRMGVLGRRSIQVRLFAGTRRMPALAPLPRLDRTLARVVPEEGMELSKAVERAVKADRGLADRLRDDVREELAGRGLLRVERTKVVGVIPRTRLEVTAAGEVWAAGSWQRERALEGALRHPGAPGALAPQVAALGGLMLLLSPAPLAELDAALHRLRDGSATGAVQGASAPHDRDEGEDAGDEQFEHGALDLGDMAALDTFDASFDAAIDAGGGDGGGGGGDGGGGGNGGGGG